MQDYYTQKGRHVSLFARRRIEPWLKEGKSNREIARLLVKSPQTIHREVKRALVRQ